MSKLYCYPSKIAYKQYLCTLQFVRRLDIEVFFIIVFNRITIKSIKKRYLFLIFEQSIIWSADLESESEKEINSLVDCSFSFDTCECSCCLQRQELQTPPSVSTKSEVITRPTREKTTTEETTTEDLECDGLWDTIARRAKLNNNELCWRKPFKSGHQAIDCELADGQR